MHPQILIINTGRKGSCPMSQARRTNPIDGRATPLFSCYLTGRPVTARPMMSRWISLVPSKIV